MHNGNEIFSNDIYLLCSSEMPRLKNGCSCHSVSFEITSVPYNGQEGSRCNTSKTSFKQAFRKKEKHNPRKFN